MLIEGSDVLIIAILVLWVGTLITERIPFLKKYSIPVAVTGGLLCSVIVLIVSLAGRPTDRV